MAVWQPVVHAKHRAAERLLVGAPRHPSAEGSRVPHGNSRLRAWVAT
jgi:hypothetical protein